MMVTKIARGVSVISIFANASFFLSSLHDRCNRRLVVPISHQPPESPAGNKIIEVDVKQSPNNHSAAQSIPK